MRCFIAVDIPESVKRKIETNFSSVRKRAPDLKWVETKNIHITLKFLGEVNERKLPQIEDALRKIAASTPPFQIQIGSPGSFNAGGGIRVLWLGIQSGQDSLAHLAAKIEDAMHKVGFKRERREFKAHLTLARSRKHGPKIRFSQLGIPESKYPPFTVSEIILYKSTLTPQGPIYEKLKKFALKG